MKTSQQDQPNPRGGSRPAALSPPRRGRRFLESPLAMLLFLILFLPALPAVAETLFTTQTPASTDLRMGPYELGMKFQSAVPGQITAIRYWKDAERTGQRAIPAISGNATTLSAPPGPSRPRSTLRGRDCLRLAAASPRHTAEYSGRHDLRGLGEYVSHYVATVGGLVNSQSSNGNLSSVADGQQWRIRQLRTIPNPIVQQHQLLPGCGFPAHSPR